MAQKRPYPFYSDLPLAQARHMAESWRAEEDASIAHQGQTA